MENSSKALLIAGAILITLLIISLSVIIYNSVTGSANEEQRQLTVQEIQMFNKQFTKYAGKNVSAINTQNLINAIKSNNAKYEKGAIKHIYVRELGLSVILRDVDMAIEMVEPELNDLEDIDLTSIRINSKSLYDIDVETNEDTGLVETITINKVTNILR